LLLLLGAEQLQLDDRKTTYVLSGMDRAEHVYNLVQALASDHSRVKPSGVDVVVEVCGCVCGGGGVGLGGLTRAWACRRCTRTSGDGY
jgi:hypothetical protein